MPKIFVTGAAGFIGSNTCSALLDQGYSVVGIDNFDDYYSPVAKERNVAPLLKQATFELLQIDVRDTNSIMSAFAQHQPDYVVHLAALAGVRASVARPTDYVLTNMAGTTNILEAAKTHRPKHVVIASTSSVYGKTKVIPFVEDDLANEPLAPYPATKRATELLGYTYNNYYDLDLSFVRFFSVYGPNGRPDMMPYLVSDSILHGKEIKLFDGGQMHRDWTYVGDIAAGVIGLLEHPNGYQIYNLGRGEPVLMADFVKYMEALAGKSANYIEVPAPKSEPKITYADISKAQSVFGYSPQVDIKTGLEKFWEWRIQQPDVLEK